MRQNTIRTNANSSENTTASLAAKPVAVGRDRASVRCALLFKRSARTRNPRAGRTFPRAGVNKQCGRRCESSRARPKSGSLRGGAFSWSARRGRPKCTGPPARGAGPRPLGELRRQRGRGTRRDTGRAPAPAVASGSVSRSAGNVGTRDAAASQAAAKAEPRPRRGGARGPPPQSGQLE